MSLAAQIAGICATQAFRPSGVKHSGGRGMLAGSQGGRGHRKPASPVQGSLAQRD
jgi:hypothetical protein